MAPKLVLMLTQQNGVSHIQIYGDSLLVIQWMKGEYNFWNFTLQPLFHDILNIKSAFSHIAFVHVYRDRNKEADRLSKKGVGTGKRNLEDH